MNKYLSKIKYPKLILLTITFILAYIIFREKDYLPFYNLIISSGYRGAFLAGIFFAFSFTAAPATAVLLILAGHLNIFWASVIAGLSAAMGDLVIFKLVRFTFRDEIEKLSATKILVFLKLKTPNIIRKYFVPVLAGLLIASPLPDEIGVSLLASSSKISTPWFLLMSYLLNLTGIFVILILGSAI
jgi:uncharacterized membrane protein YdjX (TVP38/TMEM64 family)